MMLLLFAALLPGLSEAQSQGQNVPASVKSAFESAINTASVDWQLGPNGSYEALFSKSGSDNVFVYNKAGKLIEKKQSTETILLPTSIGNTLAYDYPRGKIERAYKVSTSAQKKYYEVHVNSGGNVDRVQFDIAGRFLAVVQFQAPKEAPAPILASNTTPASQVQESGPMRGEAPAEDEDLEQIDSDIADLFEEEEEEVIDPAEDDAWDVILEDDEEEVVDSELENWDVVEDATDDVDPE